MRVVLCWLFTSINLVVAQRKNGKARKMVERLVYRSNPGIKAKKKSDVLAAKVGKWK